MASCLYNKSEYSVIKLVIEISYCLFSFLSFYHGVFVKSCKKKSNSSFPRSWQFQHNAQAPVVAIFEYGLETCLSLIPLGLAAENIPM